MSIAAVSAAPVPVTTHATLALPTAASAPASATDVSGGGGGIGGLLGKLFNTKTLLFAGIGAAAGMLVPIIPGGPIGGAAIGAALALFL